MIEFFPLDEPRSGQVAVLNAVDQALNKGYKNILLEAPVGSGKSAIAITIARYIQSKLKPGVPAAHILTPRKALQDQYWEDFHNLDLCVMKGRSAYPCTYDKPISFYNSATTAIKAGEIFKFKGLNCAEAPCVAKPVIRKICTKKGEKPCPYQTAIATAQNKKYIIHNLHSFMFQAYFSENFDVRELIVIDECHEMEGTVRDFATREITVPIDKEPPESFNKLSQWVIWFRSFIHIFSDIKSAITGISPREKYEGLLLDLENLSTYGFEEEFIVDTYTEKNKTVFKFIPKNVSKLIEKFLLGFGKTRILLSGTIYDKNTFCIDNGLDPKETYFIRIGSTMPLKSRPIYLKPEYSVDTSHKNWDNNFKEILSKIKKVFDIFSDVKGLIHSPSYKASLELSLGLKSDRLIVHDSKNFQENLSEFYEDNTNKVLISPICQQGVDFKYERARFQIILRVPYLNTSDKFVANQLANNYSWYNRQALIIFGQQLGRINRADDDFGVTILMDTRFNDFINKNKRLLPDWVKEAIITR